MTKLEDMIEEVARKLQSYTGFVGTYATLAEPITASASTFTLSGAVFADGSGIQPNSLIEIGTEIIFIQAIDRSTGAVTGALRGFKGSTPTAHSAGAGVEADPQFFRFDIITSINDTINNLYPSVFAMKAITVTPQARQMEFDLPATTLQVVSVQYKSHVSNQGYRTSLNWTFDSVGSNSTGKSLSILDHYRNQPIQIIVFVEPTALAIGQDFTVSGLESWLKETVIFGACWRLISFIDVYKATNTAQVSGMNNSVAPIGSGTNLAKYFLGMYQQALEQARQKQQKRFPAKIHWTNQ